MNEKRTRRPFPALLFLVIALLLIGGAAYGYAQAGPGLSSPTNPAPTPAPTPSPDEVDQVSRELYCPVCPSVRLDTCDLPLCDQMREVIRQKLTAGETKAQIKAYFVEQYGEVVLGVPPKQGGMIVVWVLPFLVVLVAGGWMYRLIRRRARQRADEEEEAAAALRSLPAEYVERLERDLEELE